MRKSSFLLNNLSNFNEIILNEIILNVTKKQGFISLEKLFSEKPQGAGSN